jgi:AraC-like DNA-binding protein
MTTSNDSALPGGRLNGAISAAGAMLVRAIDRTEPYVAIWWCFAISVATSALPRIYGEFAGPLAYFVAIAGSAGCAWGWLFSRALFRPAAKPVEPWCGLAVGAVIGVESFWRLTSGSAVGGFAGEALRVAANSASMICMAALVMIFVEALSGYRSSLPRGERRFRQLFVLTFAAMIAVAVLWVGGPDETSIAERWENAILTVCAGVGIIMSRLAIAYRRRHPLAEGPTRGKAAKSPIAADNKLAQQVLAAATDEDLLTTPNLKIADFAAALGEQEYKISQCITGPLGYRNFNQFINANRIERAKAVLTDARNAGKSIGAIAFDCGFNSIGPFNRAFKQCAGVTPRQFRAGHTAHSPPG